jgi:hypothetical protein
MQAGGCSEGTATYAPIFGKSPYELVTSRLVGEVDGRQGLAMLEMPAVLPSAREFMLMPG